MKRLDDHGDAFPEDLDPDVEWTEEDLPEDYDHELALRNGELLALVESEEEAQWIMAFNQLLADLRLSLWEDPRVDPDSFSAQKDSIFPDCYRLAQVAQKLELAAKAAHPQRYGAVVYYTRMRKRAQRLAKNADSGHSLNHPDLQIKSDTDRRVGEHIKDKGRRLAWLRQQLSGTPPKILRLQLAKASLEDVGEQLESIAQAWAKESGENEMDCIDLCFSYFTQEVLRRFPSSGWIELPGEIAEVLSYETAEMHRYLELDENHLRTVFANRTNRVLKGRLQLPEGVRAKIDTCIDEHEDKLST